MIPSTSSHGLQDPEVDDSNECVQTLVGAMPKSVESKKSSKKNESKSTKQKDERKGGSRKRRKRSEVLPADSPDDMEQVLDELDDGSPLGRRRGIVERKRRSSMHVEDEKFSDSDESEDENRRRRTSVVSDWNSKPFSSAQQKIRDERRVSVQEGVLESLSHLMDPGLLQDEDEDLSDKNLFQLSREGDARTIERILSKMHSPSKLLRAVNQLDGNKFCCLHYAARYHHLNVVRMLVRFGADVNIKGDDGLTPLHFCARYKTAEKSSLVRLKDELLKNNVINVEEAKDEEAVVKRVIGVSDNSGREGSVIAFLVAMGARVNERDRYGLTPLHSAAMRGNDEATMELLTCPDIDIECKDEQLLTPLHLACTYGQTSVARILLEHNADLRSSGEKRQTSLHKACAVGNLELVEMLIFATEQIHGRKMVEQLLKDEDSESNTPLLLAVESGSVDITAHLLKHGANVNHYNKARVHALHLACTIGSLDIVELLLNEKASINCVNASHQTPLLVASAYNHVAIIRYLLKKGAKIETRDKDNFTPLLLASAEGNAEALDALLHNAADIYALDKEDKSALYWAAVQNHIGALNIILKDLRSKALLETSDRYENTPLHVAAEKGFLGVVIALLEAGGDVDKKNEDERTPLHMAAMQGRTKICKEILKRDKFAVNDEDSDSNTALHLACIHGHSRVVALLIASGAEIEARNYYLWTPLDCAAAYGQPKCVKLLLDNSASIDPIDKNKTTPLHLTARFGHDKTARMLIERGASLTQSDSRGHNALTIAILNGKKDVARVIIDSDFWLEALQSEFRSPVTLVRETPLRLLIKQFPDLAKRVFDKCMETNQEGKNLSQYASFSVDDPRFSITFNYELLDDAYCVFADEHEEDASQSISIDHEDDNKLDTGRSWAKQEIWDENHHLLPNVKAYSQSSTILRLNHPLMIMAKEQRTSLLGHPLCMALVRHKWNSFGRYVYYTTLALYLTFVLLLTEFILYSPAPYNSEHIAHYSKNKSDGLEDRILDLLSESKASGFNSESVCEELEAVVNIQERSMAKLGKWGIIGLALLHLLKELFQLTQNWRSFDSHFEWARLRYLGLENLIEWTCYITAILLVLDLNECHTRTGLRYGWQWQIGAFSITLSWLNLLSNVRKFPFLGIYVVMFTDVLQTFLRFSIICTLFILAFSLGFYTLLSEQENFRNIGIAMIKTWVMMIGEFEFDDVFFDNVSQADDERRAILPFRPTSLTFFMLFVIIMSIIVMNLLVGLAVDDIKSVQDNAVLQRLAMQVTLNLDVEKLLPDIIRRKFVVRQQTLFPNQRKSILAKVIQDDNTLKRIAKSVVAHGNESELQRLLTRQEELFLKQKSSKEYIKSISHELEQIKAFLNAFAKHLDFEYEEDDNEN